VSPADAVRATSHPGEALGLPRDGPGSVAGFGRRLVGIGLDWALAVAISVAFLDGALLGPNIVLGVMHVLLVGTIGSSIGHRLLGMQLIRTDGGFPGPGRALVRTALLLLALPALVWDRDQRGLHDRAAGTVLVRR
jgi:uncharacterized RDD family membrane protein YckC